MAGMQVVLFRHGIAEDREIFAGRGLPDSERPLTGKGGRRTRQAARGLACLLPALDAIGTSPYLRARQTADIVAGVYEEAGRVPERETIDAMRPGGELMEVRRSLERELNRDVVALVGHEPDLSELMAWFTTGRPEGHARFKKAGACLIEFPGRPGRGDGELLWLVPPSILRRLAG